MSTIPPCCPMIPSPHLEHPSSPSLQLVARVRSYQRRSHTVQYRVHLLISNLPTTRSTLPPPPPLPATLTLVAGEAQDLEAIPVVLLIRLYQPAHQHIEALLLIRTQRSEAKRLEACRQTAKPWRHVSCAVNGSLPNGYSCYGR